MKYWLSLCVLLMLTGHPVGAAPDDGATALRQTQSAFVNVARSVSPSVVSLRVEQHAQEIDGLPLSPFGPELFERFFGEQWPDMPGGDGSGTSHAIVGQGSGFVYRSDRSNGTGHSYILTNRHVVADAENILVRLQDGREMQARVKGVDPQSDVAILEVAVAGLPSLPLGDSSRLEVGDWALAIGSPFGLKHTLTVGVVSAKGRTSLGIADYEDFIQTDAAINPGNSGGPLVNLEGEVVGMNSAILSRSGGYLGIGFAIPINLARHVADQLIENGEVVRGFLGVAIQPVTPALADNFGLDRARGILIARVNDDSPASRGGLQQGDIVLSFRGRTVDDIGAFRNRVAQTAPGTPVELEIVRDGRQRNVQVRLGRLESDPQQSAAAAPSRKAQPLGLSVQTLTRSLADQLGIDAAEGVVVTGVVRGSPAAEAGIGEGSVILQVDRQAVKNASDFQRRIAQSAGDGQVLLLVREGDFQRYLVIDLG